MWHTRNRLLLLVIIRLELYFSNDRIDLALGVDYQSGKTSLEDIPAPFSVFNAKQTNCQAKWVLLGADGYIKKVSENFAYSLSLEGPRTFKSSCPNGFALFGETGRHLGEDLTIPVISLTGSWKISPCTSIGIGIPFAIGRVKENGFQNLEAESIHPHHTTNKGYSYAYNFALKIGWMWKILPDLSFGISYTTPEIACSHWHKYKGFHPQRGKFQNVPEMRVGMAFAANCDWNIVLETYWSFFGTTRLTSNSPHSQHLLGTFKGPSKGWKNLIIYKIGTDYKLMENLIVRCGYSYNRPLISSSNALGNLGSPVGTVKNTLSAGFTWIHNNIELSVSETHFFRNKVRGREETALFGGRITLSHEDDIIYAGLGIPF